MNNINERLNRLQELYKKSGECTCDEDGNLADICRSCQLGNAINEIGELIDLAIDEATRTTPAVGGDNPTGRAT